MSWSSIIGQTRVKGLLAGLLRSGRLAHAYLFFGPEGVGKDATAIEFAKAASCDRSKGEACDVCDNCRQIDHLRHPNLRLVFPMPVGKNEKAGEPPLAKLTAEDLSNIQTEIQRKALNKYHKITVPRGTTIKVNSIRELKRSASLSAFSGGRKFMLIFDADRMNDESANSLLKTLEEPPGDTTFILTTSFRDQLLSTIVSRCQPVRFDFLSEEDIARALIERNKIEEARAALVARLAHGSMTRATELLELDLQEQRKAVVQYLRDLYEGDTLRLTSVMETLSRTFGSDRQQVERFLHLLSFWIRDVLCVMEGHSGIVNIDQRESIERFAQSFHSLDCPAVLEMLERYISLVAKNVYIPLVLQNLTIDLVEIMHRGRTTPISQTGS